MNESNTGSTATAVPKRRAIARRRRFLVNRRYQFKVAILTVSMMLVLLVLLNFSILSNSMKETEDAMAIAPEFEEYLHGQDRVQFMLILLASLVFMVGVFLVSLLETHKTAGAAVNISNRLEEVRKGSLAARVKLRKDDNLQDLEPAFNQMAEALATRAWEEIEILEKLAARLDEAKSLESDKHIAGELKKLAREKRQSVE
jgi:nitrogen fixation/metabolism regulation signal transduction histidine kinase